MPIPSGMKDLGYQQITTLTTATALTVPAGTVGALITCEAQAVRWRSDGTDPTALIGYPLAVGAELEYDEASFPRLKFIEQVVGAKLNVVYFGSPVGV